MLISKIGIEENEWLFGPWNSSSPVELSYFRKPKVEIHSHDEVFEYYLVVEGLVKFKVNGKEYHLKKRCLYDRTRENSGFYGNGNVKRSNVFRHQISIHTKR